MPPPHPGTGLDVQGNDLGLVPGNAPPALFFFAIIGPVSRLLDPVAPIEGHDQQPAVQKGRGAKPMATVVSYLLVSPDDPPVETHGRPWCPTPKTNTKNPTTPP